LGKFFPPLGQLNQAHPQICAEGRLRYGPHGIPDTSVNHSDDAQSGRPGPDLRTESAPLRMVSLSVGCAA
jgi:hypothetical protein